MTQKESAADGTDAQVRRALRQTLQCTELAGVEFVARPSSFARLDAAAPEATAEKSRIDEVAGTACDSQPAKSVLSANSAENTTRSTTCADTTNTLNVMQQEVRSCTSCAELAERRTQTVFGVGNPAARLCLLGEAPGADEDRLGEPFVGRAGQLLDKILAACTLTREDVYILNVLKCRPPQNRTPAAEEVENCRGFFERQLELIQPEFICCLGSVAASSLLRTKSTLGRLRGTFHDWRGIQVVVTYHPAYLLRNPSAKAHTWKDMQMLMQAMGIRLP